MDPLELSSSLRTAVSTMHKMLRNQSSSISEYSMTERETIGHLIRNPFLLPTDLANLTKVKTQSMSHILNKLEEQGVIKRTPSKDDKRKVYISITPAGKKIVEKVRYEWDEWLKGIIEKSLSEKEKEMIFKSKGEKLQETLFTFWTFKEAIIKALGVGLNADLTQIDLSDFFYSGSNPLAFDNNSIYTIKRIKAPEGCMAALAIKGKAGSCTEFNYGEN